MTETWRMKVWLDDERPMPPEFNRHMKTAEDAIAMLATGLVETISLDHDLGAEKNGTGYDVACFIERAAYSGQLAPIEIMIHSANPVGRERMEQAIAKATEFWRHKTAQELKTGTGSSKC